MTPSQSIREEFEKAYHNEYDQYDPCSHLAIALWAAKWAMERCVNVAINITPCESICHCASEVAENISELAKGLDQ